MKEMCRNFVCDPRRCPQAPTDQPTPTPPTENCNSCVLEAVGLAQAMIPDQPYTAPMPQEQSLVCGTVFADLVMPYCADWNLYRFGKEV